VFAGGVGIAENLYVGGDLTVTTSNSLVVDDYTINQNSELLDITRGTSGANARLTLKTADGDGTDFSIMETFGVTGANSEFMRFGYTPSGQHFFFTTLKTGSGTSRDIVFESSGIDVAVINATTNEWDFKQPVQFDDTTGSTSTTTGCAVFDGGIGVAENIYTGGLLDVAGDFVLDNYTFDPLDSSLTIANTVSAQNMRFIYESADGDGTDSVMTDYFGITGSNSEYLRVGYNGTNTDYEIRPFATGTGTIRDITFRKDSAGTVFARADMTDDEWDFNVLVNMTSGFDAAANSTIGNTIHSTNSIELSGLDRDWETLYRQNLF